MKTNTYQTPNLKGFKFSNATAEISSRLDNAAKPTSEWTKLELHKYMKVKWNTIHVPFDELVGKYNPDDVNIEGLQISKAAAVLLMTDMIKRANQETTPFMSLVQTSAELSVSPAEYTITNKIGSVDTISMVRGLPKTEQPSMIIAHQNLTFAMSMSAPEFKKVTNEDGEEERTMSHSVPADPEGLLMPSSSPIALLPVIDQYYTASPNVLSIRAKILTQAHEAGNMMDIGAVCLLATQSMVARQKEIKQWKPEWDPYDIVRPITDKGQAALYLRADVEPLQLVPQPKLPTYPITTMEQLWEFIAIHQKVRGGEKSRIAPLTHAVYYGEVDHYYKQIMQTADIIQLYNYLPVKSTVRQSDHKHFKKAWTLAQLNLPISTSATGYPLWNNEPYGMYRNKMDVNTLVIDCFEDTAPYKDAESELWTYKFTPVESQKKLTYMLKAKAKVAIKTYPYPGIWDDFQGRIHPSVYAHTGAVWVTNYISSAYSEILHIERTVKANTLKTYYPCYMKKLPPTDIIVWPSVYIKRTAKRKVNLGFTVMYTKMDAQLDEVDITEVDFKQAAIRKKEAEKFQSLPAVKQFTQESAKIVPSQLKISPDPSPQPPPATTVATKDSQFADLQIDDPDWG